MDARQVSSRLERRSALDDARLGEVQRGAPGEHAYADSKRAPGYRALTSSCDALA